MIIAFGYKKNSGKDTACNYLKYYHKFTHRAFATPLKRATKGMLLSNTLELETQEQKEELDPITGLSYRKIMQKMGDCLKREFGPDIFCKILGIDIERLVQIRDVAISDMRSKTEFDYIKSLGGYCVRIDRPETQISGDIHRTEVELDSIPNDDWDYIITNDGDLVEFTNKVAKMLQHFGFEDHIEEAPVD